MKQLLPVQLRFRLGGTGLVYETAPTFQIGDTIAFTYTINLHAEDGVGGQLTIPISVEVLGVEKNQELSAD